MNASARDAQVELLARLAFVAFYGKWPDEIGIEPIKDGGLEHFREQARRRQPFVVREHRTAGVPKEAR